MTKTLMNIIDDCTKDMLSINGCHGHYVDVFFCTNTVVVERRYEKYVFFGIWLAPIDKKEQYPCLDSSRIHDEMIELNNKEIETKYGVVTLVINPDNDNRSQVERFGVKI